MSEPEPMIAKLTNTLGADHFVGLPCEADRTTPRARSNERSPQ